MAKDYKITVVVAIDDKKDHHRQRFGDSQLKAVSRMILASLGVQSDRRIVCEPEFVLRRLPKSRCKSPDPNKTIKTHSAAWFERKILEAIQAAYEFGKRNEKVKHSLNFDISDNNSDYVGPILDAIKSILYELEATGSILRERQLVLDMIPECNLHGSCIPHQADWIDAVKTMLNDRNSLTNKQLKVLGITTLPDAPDDALLKELRRRYPDAYFYLEGLKGE